jgi:hypothetical protein
VADEGGRTWASYAEQQLTARHQQLIAEFQRVGDVRFESDARANRALLSAPGENWTTCAG